MKGTTMSLDCADIKFEKGLDMEKEINRRPDCGVILNPLPDIVDSRMRPFLAPAPLFLCQTHHSPPSLMAPYNGKRPRKVNDTDPAEATPKTLKSQNTEKHQTSDSSDSESDVQMGSAESSDGDVEFADPTHPESKLVSDVLSESAHVKLDKKVLRRYPWIDDDEQDDRVIYSRVTLLRSLVRDYDQLDGQYAHSHSYLGIRELFHKHPWLISVLNECWRNGSFRTIRLLSAYTLQTLTPYFNVADPFLYPGILQGTNTFSSRSWTTRDQETAHARAGVFKLYFFPRYFRFIDSFS